jgi:uncharacterized membrane protein YccC
MMSRAFWIALGFDLPRLRFAFHTAIAACIAFLIAWRLGLDHPQWSAMTVWAASQPTRGQLLEKGLFRAIGTAIGVLAGVALLLMADGAPLILVLGLSLWIGICVTVGNLLRGPISYGVILAGYSAAMVALLDFGQPGHVFVLGLDRAATIFLGVLVAVNIGFLLTPAAAEEEMVGRMRRLTIRLLERLADRLRHGGSPGLTVDEMALLSDMAAIDEQCDPHAAGSLRRRQTVRAIRSILSMQISLLLAARRIETGGLDACAATLDLAIARFAALDLSEKPLRLLDQAAAEADGLPGLAQALSALAGGIRAHRASLAAKTVEPPAAYPGVLHRDWIGAREAGIRASVSLLLTGLVWVATGWASLAFLLLGLSIMVTIFSTFDNPTQILRAVFVGHVYGCCAALLCHYLVWPLAGSEFQVVLLTLPFILAAPLLFSHRHTVASAFDYAMVSLLLLHPHYPVTGDFLQSLLTVAALVGAPVVAYGVFRLIYPLTTRRRLATLSRMMIDELQIMARKEDASRHRLVWRARLYHRLLRLVRHAERSGASSPEVIEGGIAVLTIGEAILALQERIMGGHLDLAEKRAALAALERLKHLQSGPAKAQAALARAAGRLEARHDDSAGVVRGAAFVLQRELGFFAGQVSLIVN